MIRLVTIFGVIFLYFLSGCTPVKATYPSYENVMAKYQPNGEMEGIKGENDQCDDEGCDCPRFWYRNHWVYHCDDDYYYWYHGDWYYYPHPHIYYFEGPRYYPSGPGRRITKD